LAGRREMAGAEVKRHLKPGTVLGLRRARGLLAAPSRVTEPETDTPTEPDQPLTLPKPSPAAVAA
jgi:hypothetical protein